MTQAGPHEDAVIPLSVSNHLSHPGWSRQRVMIPVDGLTRSMVWSPVPFSVDQLVAGRHPLPLAGSSSRRDSFQPIHDFNSAAVEHSAPCVGWLVQLVLNSLTPMLSAVRSRQHVRNIQHDFSFLS